MKMHFHFIAFWIKSLIKQLDWSAVKRNMGFPIWKQHKQTLILIKCKRYFACNLIVLLLLLLMLMWISFFQPWNLLSFFFLLYILCRVLLFRFFFSTVLVFDLIYSFCHPKSTTSFDSFWKLHAIENLRCIWNPSTPTLPAHMHIFVWIIIFTDILIAMIVLCNVFFKFFFFF